MMIYPAGGYPGEYFPLLGPPPVPIVGLHVTGTHGSRSGAALTTRGPVALLQVRTAGVTLSTQAGRVTNVTSRRSRVTDEDSN